MGQTPALRKRELGDPNTPRAGADSRPGDLIRLINSLGFDKTMSGMVQEPLRIEAALAAKSRFAAASTQFSQN
jgi:hypothetical protein